MTKELEALHLIRVYLDTEGELEMSNELNIIESALEEKEQNQKYYNKIAMANLEIGQESCRLHELVDKQLNDLLKLEMFVKIIKERKVNLEYLKCCDTYEQYCLICSYANEITEEYFDLLKEVLK